MFGNSITFIVHENELVLGGSQYLYFYEFDGPRERQVLGRRYRLRQEE
ncbi:MAG: YjbQ family protein [[Clostridium] scindens]